MAKNYFLTEDKAKTKTCPFSLNNSGYLTGIPCQASGCMAWRFHRIVDPNHIESSHRSGLPSPPPPTPTVESDSGYCGLVG